MDEALPAPAALDAAVLTRLQDRALRFVTPGLVHRLNNALAHVSTHVHLLDAGEAAAVAWRRQQGEALATTVARASRCLTLLDDVAKFAEQQPRDPAFAAARAAGELTEVGSLLRAMADVVVCERGAVRLGIDVRCETPLYTRVPPPTVLVLTLLAIASIADVVPVLLPGTILLLAERPPGSDSVQIVMSFEVEAGHLPFAVTLPPVDRDLAAAVAASGGTLTPDQRQPTLSLTLPA